MAVACAACPGSDTGTDADANSDAVFIDVASDGLDGLELLEAGVDAMDARAEVPVDVQPAPLPGHWRLVGFVSTRTSGETMALTDTETHLTLAGRATYGRVNGTMTLASDRMESTLAVLLEGHVLTDTTVGSASEAMAAAGSAAQGTLGPASFGTAAGATTVFATSADGTITNSASLGTLGRVELTWARADTLPVPAGLSAQGYVLQLQPGMAAPLAHPRVAIAWDRPGLGAGYRTTSDQPAVFAGGGGVAAVSVLVTYVLPEYTATFDGTTFSLGYVMAYDDVNDNGRFDSTAATGNDGGFDGGTTGDAATGLDGSRGPADGDPVRGVSRVVITVRSFLPGSRAFLASPFRDVPAGVQRGVLREDTTAPGGTSVGTFDPTHPIAPDGVVENGGTRLPDLL